MHRFEGIAFRKPVRQARAPSPMMRAAPPEPAHPEPLPPAAAPQPPASGPGLLQLSDPAPAPPAARQSAAPARTPPQRRIAPGQRMILTQSEPTVTLNRVQSAVGALEIEAAWMAAQVGDLRLGCVYELRSGMSTVQQSAGRRQAPPGSDRPVLYTGGGEFERILVDLRQSQELERLIVYAATESGQPARWAGTLVVRTPAQSRVEIPLEMMAPGSLAVVASLYNIAGEFVLRAEQWTAAGTVRDGCQAFGFDRITWLDGRTPTE